MISSHWVFPVAFYMPYVREDVNRKNLEKKYKEQD
uniref:Uncharacterized protein n=1 Tax=virus sp. ctFlR8 TaxID=2825811 RepID=A0A8S5RNR2_9VIRU|nr:MAG TPA: hypothetical protein [virus sp. ctFlR8]DAF18648.1 MAG TPA: hypothetical protein [Caudoviricetes sp.]DAT90730.1 MAG TPA: hypothetical protein [Bacteriophage sp.]DAQ34717.1 MAG TPA: hypothetical protein [Caudoviricetes sp.]DAR44725.1 MAG TPA: hypothetical protein [Caudoviricetes sp.]